MGAIMDSLLSHFQIHFQKKHRGEQRLDGWMDFGDIAYEQPLGPQDDRKNFWAR